MKIEKINDNQIKCTLDKSDLTERHLELGELAYGSDKAKKLFRDMMQQAFQDFGFDVEDNPLMVEAIPLSADSIVLLITKVDDPEELDTRFSRFAPVSDEDSSETEPEQAGLDGAQFLKDLLEGKPVSDEASDEKKKISTVGKRIFAFTSLDRVSEAAALISPRFDGFSSLFRSSKNGRFYLIISSQGYSAEEFFRITNTLQEFGTMQKSTPAMEAHIEEHCLLMIDGIALQVMKDL